MLNPSSLPHNQPPAADPRPADPAEARAGTEVAEAAEAEKAGQDEDDDDFDDGGGLSISAMEAELREGVMETLDAIAGDFEAFRKLQEKLVETPAEGRGPQRQGPQGLRRRCRRPSRAT